METLRVINYESFAKINLFLHILNKRNDGYHNLQSWFTFLDLKDDLTFSFNTSNEVNIFSKAPIAEKEDNLIFRAIKAFQKYYSVQRVGVDISINKKIPMGAGLGGGSSNAATALIAMRDYYMPELRNLDMLNVGAKLGADVPIFLYGRSAWAEGIGEILYPKDFSPKYALLIKPNIHISTKDFFVSKTLIKTKNILMKEEPFDTNVMHNDFERVFFSKYPQFKKVLNVVSDKFRMTGTGSCFYLLSDSKPSLEKLATKIDKNLDKWIVKTLNYVY